MFGACVVVGLLALLTVALVWWVIAGEVGERRRARAAASAQRQDRARHSVSE